MNDLYTASIIDIYHGDKVNIPLMAQNGVTACLLKATQGTGYIDPTFQERHAAATAYGLLTGSYHFMTGEDVGAQFNHWMQQAQFFSGKEAYAVDWESNSGGSTASYAQVCQMVQLFFERVGRYPLLYGSNFLHEKIPTDDSILFKCPLWIAAYSSKPTIPIQWQKYTLWQYTGDGQSPNKPNTFPGAGNYLDVSRFDGTIDELRAAWPFE